MSDAGAGGKLANAEYAGFWVRFLAYLIDGVVYYIIALIALMIIGIDMMSMTPDPTASLVQILIGLAYWVGFWSWKAATPGKMALGLVVVDGETGEPKGVGGYVLRYIGYFVSSIILGIGFIMIGLTDRKRGLHDMIAGTVVVKADSLG